jgi:hypothetical protein
MMRPGPKVYAVNDSSKEEKSPIQVRQGAIILGVRPLEPLLKLGISESMCKHVNPGVRDLFVFVVFQHSENRV